MHPSLRFGSALRLGLAALSAAGLLVLGAPATRGAVLPFQGTLTLEFAVDRSDVDAVVTDASARPEAVAQIEQAGAAVHRA